MLRFMEFSSHEFVKRFGSESVTANSTSRAWNCITLGQVARFSPLAMPFTLFRARSPKEEVMLQ
jgi:hypothetical protein